MSSAEPRELHSIIEEVRRSAPLVHCLTATVTMNFVADALLAAGARPMMTETLDEAPALTRHADALLVNLGTLSTDGMAGVPATVEICNELGNPWVLDPVAVGAAPRRTRLAHELLDQRPRVVKGNASEIRALAGQGSGGSGPDATDEVDTAHSAAAWLADRSGAVIATTGPSDLVTVPQSSVPQSSVPQSSTPQSSTEPATPALTTPPAAARHTELHLGHPLLARITGSGCALGALIAACVAVSDPLAGTLAALHWMNGAGERAAERAAGPGSFRVQLLDAIDSFPAPR